MGKEARASKRRILRSACKRRSLGGTLGRWRTESNRFSAVCAQHYTPTTHQMHQVPGGISPASLLADLPEMERVSYMPLPSSLICGRFRWAQAGYQAVGGPPASAKWNVEHQYPRSNSFHFPMYRTRSPRRFLKKPDPPNSDSTVLH
jgi:hypothetical protein